MTKFEAMKQLPVERFADLFYEMCRKAGSMDKFKEMLNGEFPDSLIPALHDCSTGADLNVIDDAILSDSNNSHHGVMTGIFGGVGHLGERHS